MLNELSKSNNQSGERNRDGGRGQSVALIHVVLRLRLKTMQNTQSVQWVRSSLKEHPIIQLALATAFLHDQNANFDQRDLTLSAGLTNHSVQITLSDGLDETTLQINSFRLQPIVEAGFY